MLKLIKIREKGAGELQSLRGVLILKDDEAILYFFPAFFIHATFCTEVWSLPIISL
jgi:hypothetical protein